MDKILIPVRDISASISKFKLDEISGMTHDALLESIVRLIMESRNGGLNTESVYGVIFDLIYAFKTDVKIPDILIKAHMTPGFANLLESVKSIESTRPVMGWDIHAPGLKSQHIIIYAGKCND